MSKLTAVLTKKYDLVIIDSPPSLPVGDALLIGKVADVVIFIAKAGVVRKKQLKTAIGFHESIGNNIFGVCLNMVPILDRVQEYGYQSSKDSYESTYGYRYYYRNKNKNPYAPISTDLSPKKTIIEFIKQFKST
jgi:Mrp family chromosome partitioning ATPase